MSKINLAKIEDFLHKRNVNCVKLDIFSQISSTNKVLVQRCKEDKTVPEFLTLLTDEQTAGYGRMQRSWSSVAGKNLYFSMVLKPDISPQFSPQISIIAAISVFNALKKAFSRLDFKMKWPNDIFLNGKKMCGILSEMQTFSTKIEFIVLGIGVNINQVEFLADLEKIATSIKLATGNEENRNLIFSEIMCEFVENYHIWQQQGLAPFLLSYHKNSFLLHRKITLTHGNQEISGIVLGFSNVGNLLLKTNNEILELTSGEIHITSFNNK